MGQYTRAEKRADPFKQRCYSWSDEIERFLPELKVVVSDTAHVYKIVHTICDSVGAPRPNITFFPYGGTKATSKLGTYTYPTHEIRITASVNVATLVHESTHAIVSPIIRNHLKTDTPHGQLFMETLLAQYADAFGLDVWAYALGQAHIFDLPVVRAPSEALELVAYYWAKGT